MKGLLLDTSYPSALLGLANEGTLLCCQVLDGGKNLSSSLFPALAPLLDDLSYIAIGVGPGSYMGVRTGATIAKTLAFAKNLPLIEFSSLLVAIPEEISEPFVFVGDAKMGEHFLIEGTVREGQIIDLFAPKLVAKSELETHLPEGKRVLLPDHNPLHLHWAAAHAQRALIQNNLLDPEALCLSYLR